MNFFNNIFDKVYANKEIIGKILFIFSIITCVLMFVLPVSNVIFDGDEHFTMAVIKLSGMQFWQMIIDDVHPPLYYLIVKPFYNLASSPNSPIDPIYTIKMVSVFCYIAILAISGTYLRKKYDWFTAGLFAFTLATMSDFFFKFLTMRMYSFAILFFFLLFIVFLNLIENFDRKSWVALVILTVLSAYTHNILLLTLAVVYLFILFYILWTKDPKINKKRQIISWICSAIASVGLYIPWFFVLMHQVSGRRSLAHALNIMDYVNYLTFPTTSLSGFNGALLILKIISIILIIAIVIIAVKKILENRNIENFQITSGIFIYIFTLILASIIVSITFKSLTSRFMVPALTIFWLATSMLVGKIRNKKIFVILLILILAVGIYGFADTMHQSEIKYDNAINRANNLTLVHEGDVVIYSSKLIYTEFHQYFSNPTEYTLKDCKIPIENNCTIEKNVTKILEDNPGKRVFYIKSRDDTKMDKFKDVSYDNLHDNVIYRITLNNQTTQSV